MEERFVWLIVSGYRSLFCGSQGYRNLKQLVANAQSTAESSELMCPYSGVVFLYLAVFPQWGNHPTIINGKKAIFPTDVANLIKIPHTEIPFSVTLHCVHWQNQPSYFLQLLLFGMLPQQWEKQLINHPRSPPPNTARMSVWELDFQHRSWSHTQAIAPWPHSLYTISDSSLILIPIPKHLLSVTIGSLICSQRVCRCELQTSQCLPK